MPPTLTPGLRREGTHLVLAEHTAAHLGSGDLRVLATPSMILFMEMAARKLLAEHLSPGFSSVGARVDVRHLAPSQVGAEIRAVAEITEVNGKRSPSPSKPGRAKNRSGAVPIGGW